MDAGTLFLQQLINGISLGSVYALIALGYTMVYGIVKLINFAHGDILMLGAYAGYFILSSIGTTPLGMILAFAFAMILCGIAAILIERFAFEDCPQIKFIDNGYRCFSYFTKRGSGVAFYRS